MKKQPLLGLVAAGKISDSIVSRMPELRDELGPVKGLSMRVASRFTHQLQAGYPVSDLLHFNSCSTVLICVPAEKFSLTVQELAASPIDWSNKVVLATAKWHESIDTHRLNLRAAAVGLIAAIPGVESDRYLVEGDALAVREAWRLVEHGGVHLIRLRRGMRPFIVAGLGCAGPLLVPILMQAAEWFRTAQIEPADAQVLLRNELNRTLRAYFKAGRPPQPTASQVYEALVAVAADSPPADRFQRLLASIHDGRPDNRGGAGRGAAKNRIRRVRVPVPKPNRSLTP